jgi:diguanylate cyclase (GGDEF)-like protein/PAS domain S-box-containing protein
MRTKTTRSPVRVLFHIALLAGTYVLGAEIGLRLALENRNVTAVWPPTGIAVAALLLGGLRLWPGVAIGAFVGNLLNGAPVTTAAAITIGNTVAPVLGAFVLTKVLKIRTTLDRVSDVLALFFAGGFGAMSISATAGTFALVVTGAAGDTPLASLWSLWWVGDAIGVVIFAPLILLLAQPEQTAPVVKRPSEWLALIAVTAATAVAVFNVSLPVVFLVFIPVVWAALRFEQFGAACVTVALAVIALAETVSGDGPFTFLSPTENLISIQTFNGAVAFLSFVLAAVMSRRRRAEELVRSSEERFRTLFEQATDVVCIHDNDGWISYANRAAENATGFSRDRLLVMNIDELVASEDVRVMRRANARLIEGRTDSTTYEIALISTSGRRVMFEVSSTTVQDDGQRAGIQLIGRDITSRKVAEDQLRHQALHDGLTSLPNRTLLQERLEYAVALARQNRSKVALVFLDIDGFQQVNERHDRRVADRLLSSIGLRLTELFREPDTVARVASDEFAVLIASLDPGRSPAVIGEQVKAEIEGPFHIDDTMIQVTASIGVALYPTHAEDASSLMQRADFAMFAAKRGGGARYAVYQPEHDSVGARRLALIDELHVAVEEDGLVLHYQPKIEMGSMRTTGVEALIRWQHPRLGLIQPVEFVPLAEQEGIIGPLTAWVVEDGLRQCAEWAKSDNDITLSINVSTNALLDGRLVPKLEEVFDGTRTDPAKLIIEVPESTLMEEATHATIRRLAELGVQISIDDFGTGSSSMVHLQRLPISEIKVDRSFVIGMRSSGEDREVARSIIDLGHNLGVRVVAEGVETRETWDQLANLGCDEAQGFLMCRPVPIDQLDAWLRTPAWSGRVR